MKNTNTNFNKIKKIYLNFNYTILFLAIYIVCFPIVGKLLGLISPYFTKCIYKEITGNPCPLCGGTRYIANLKNAIKDPSILLHPFGFIMIFVFINLIFRIWCIRYIKKDGKNIKKIMIYDALVLVLVAIIFFTYEILFVINQYN